MRNFQKEINFRLEKIKKVFDIKKIIAIKPTTTSIANYYKLNKLAYTFFHHNDFIHMGISRSGEYSKEDLLEQAKLVDKYIRKLKAKKSIGVGNRQGRN